MLTLVDYGLGNIQAFANVYKRLNIATAIASDAEAIFRASRLILPGVGAFDWAMTKLEQSGMRSALDEMVLNRKTPVLGICVGMQIMARSSEEGKEPGLGWLDGEVRRFEASRSNQLQLPHMGWNDATPTEIPSVMTGIEAPRFYFLHSYYFSSNDPNIALAMTDYGGSFISAAGRENITGVQFHPEKSHGWGVRLLKNFAES